MGRLVIDLSEFTVVKQHDIDHDNPTPWVFGVADCVWPIASTALTRNLDFIFGKKSTDPGLSPTHRRSLQAAESKVNDCGAEAYPSLLETRVGNAPVTLRL